VAGLEVLEGQLHGDRYGLEAGRIARTIRLSPLL
jgi:hypothetical protein